MSYEAAPQDQPRKGRSNAILTYEEVSNIHLGLQKLSLQLQTLDEKVDEVKNVHIDHEIRIKALELTSARQSGSTGMATWAFPIILTLASLGIAILNYIK